MLVFYDLLNESQSHFILACMCVLIVIFSNNKKEYLTLNQSVLIILSLTFSLLKKERRKLKKCLNFSKYFRIY